MVRFKLVLLGLLAVFVVGAMASASASADSCNGGSHFVYCTFPGNLPITHELVLGTGGLFLLVFTFSGSAAKFHCESGDIHGEIELLGASSELFSFLNCKMEEPTGCKLSAAQEIEIVAHFKAQQESATLMLFTGSASGEEIFDLEVVTESGKTCALVEAGKTSENFPVTGKQMAKTPNGASGGLNQEIVTKKAESVLKVGGNPVSLSTAANVHLGGVNIGKEWLVMAGE